MERRNFYIATVLSEEMRKSTVRERLRPLGQLIRGSVARGERYWQQARRRRQVAQRRFVLVVGFVANLAGVVAGLAVALVLAVAGSGRNLHRIAVGRGASVESGGYRQYRDGEEPIHPAANHGSRDNLADCFVGSIQPRPICLKRPVARPILQCATDGRGSDVKEFERGTVRSPRESRNGGLSLRMV